MIVDGLSVEEAHFRGRKLQGTTVAIPHGYSGKPFYFLLTIVLDWLLCYSFSLICLFGFNLAWSLKCS